MSATLHALPGVDARRIFELRRLAASTGCRYIINRTNRTLNFVVIANGAEQISSLDQCSGRRFIVLDDQPPFGGDVA